MGSTTIVRGETTDSRPAIDPSQHPAILEQVERMAASPLFRNSRHYPALLRYVVDQTLRGRAPQLKERVLGFEVFGRDANYDTNSDPVVRNSACEVRKRIAQYYAEPGRDREIRIELPAGSYVPEFVFPAVEPIRIVAAPLASERTASRSRLWICVAALAIGAIVASIWLRPQSSVEKFWGPVWHSSDSLMVGLSGGNPNPQAAPGAPPLSALDVSRNDRISFSDSLTLARVTGLIGANGKSFDIRRGSLTLDDLRKEPGVLIGGYNNQWSMALEQKFRFTLEHESGTRDLYIRDAQNPAARDWTGSPDQPYSQLKEDYAIVSRFLDERTEKMVVVLAGMGTNGTVAAGEFVTSEHALDALAAKAPGSWKKKNLQVVLGTEILNGSAGPPRVLATYFW